MAKQLRLDALIRVSQQGAREGDSFRSPDQQREVCDQWAAANGATIAAEHPAVNVSGKSMERADVDAALERIRGGQTDGVIVAWLDRFSRAPVAEALRVYDDIREAGGQVVACDLAGLDPRDPTGELALTVQLGIARMQWRQRAERWNMSRADAIRDGKIIGKPPFGYRYADPTSKRSGVGVIDSRLVVHEPERPIVVELFERKAGGATWLELARWLDTVAPKPNGGLWARSTVSDMIACRTYLGEVSHGDHVNPRAHKAIVSPALFRRAQREPGRRTPRGTYLLSGTARCAGCGRTLRGTTLGRGSGARVYKCGDRSCTARSSIMVERLDAEVTEQFFAHLDAFHVRAVDDAELAEARAEVERRTAEVERMAAVVPSSTAGIASHQAALQDAEAALAEAEDHEHRLTSELAADSPDVRELRADWPTLTLDERREILRAGIDAVLVRRAPSPTAKPPAADRILVLFRGSAPDDLNGRSAAVRAWTWDDGPASLTAAA